MRELQERMDSAEFTEWLAFLISEPDMGTRTDLHLTRILGRLDVLCASWGNSQESWGVPWLEEQADGSGEDEAGMLNRLSKWLD